MICIQLGWNGSSDLKKKIFKCLHFFFTFWLRVICPLGKRHVTLLEQTWIPLRQECFVCQVVLEKKMKNFKLKFTTMTSSTTTTTYDRKLTRDASDWILSQCKGYRLNTRIPLWSWAGSCPTSSLSICLAIYFRLGLFRWIPSPKQTLSLKKGKLFLLPIGKRQSTICVHELSSVVRLIWRHHTQVPHH